MSSGAATRRCSSASASHRGAIPTFRAYVDPRRYRASDGAILPDTSRRGRRRGVREFAAARPQPPGDVEIRVDWSSVNFKDGLATQHRRQGRPDQPAHPRASTWRARWSRAPIPSIAVGSTVLAHGYDLGVARHGGYAEYQRVPAAWVVPLDQGLSARDAMAIGTAGFTAAMSVVALEERGLQPGDGPVLVTGASGGVGSTAVAILAERGHEVWAATGKPDEADRLRELGRGRDPDAGRGDRRGQAARVGAMGGCGRRGRRGHAAVCAADPADRRGGRIQRQCQRSEARHDGVPVHPARRRAARHGLGPARDRATPRHLGRGLRPTCGRVRWASTSPRSRSTRSTTPLTAILAGEARGRWVVRVGAG